MGEGRGLPASNNAAEFLARDIKFRGKDKVTKKAGSNALSAGKCTGKTDQGTDCETVAFADRLGAEKRLHYKVKMAILLEQEDAKITEELKEFGVRPQPGRFCPECTSMLAELTGECLVWYGHETAEPPPAAAAPPSLSRWTDASDARDPGRESYTGEYLPHLGLQAMLAGTWDLEDAEKDVRIGIRTGKRDHGKKRKGRK